MAQTAEALLDSVDPGRQAVRRLAEALKPKTERRLKVPHRSRGRFDYRRHARGRERSYLRRPDASEPPARPTVVLDASGSMLNRAGNKTRFAGALEATALAVRAAEIASVEVEVLPFRKRLLPRLCSRQRGHERVRVALVQLRADGETRLAPALRAAFEDFPPTHRRGPHRGRHLVLIITDGLLSGGDTHACEKLLRRARAAHRDLIVVPLLLGLDKPADVASYRTLFRRVCPVEDPTDLSEAVRRWLRQAA